MYFKDYWNIIDFLVVLEGWASVFSPAIDQWAVLRTIRLLRPLRAANHHPNVKMIVNAFLNSLSSVTDIFLSLVFFLFISGTFCSALWKGAFDYRCQDDLTGEWVDSEELCYPQTAKVDDHVCNSLVFFDDSYSCEQGLTCADFKASPEEGYLNFDNVAFGMLTLFATCTLDGWSGALFDSQNVRVLCNIVFLLILLAIALTFYLACKCSGYGPGNVSDLCGGNCYRTRDTY